MHPGLDILDTGHNHRVGDNDDIFVSSLEIHVV